LTLETGKIAPSSLENERLKIRTNTFNVKEFFREHPGEYLTIHGLRDAGFSKRIYGICKSLVKDKWLVKTTCNKTGKNYYFLPWRLKTSLNWNEDGEIIVNLDYYGGTIEICPVRFEKTQLFIMTVPCGWEMVVFFKKSYNTGKSFPARLFLTDIHKKADIPVFWIKLPRGHLSVSVDGKRGTAKKRTVEDIVVKRLLCQFSGEKGFCVNILPLKRSLVFRPLDSHGHTNHYLAAGAGHVNSDNWKTGDVIIDALIPTATRIELFPVSE